MSAFRKTMIAAMMIAPSIAAAEPEVKWEIKNRFAPFETQEEPAALFEFYQLRTGEDFAAWHRRLDAAPNGVLSPYRMALATQKHASLMHWDQEKLSHRDEILRFVREEKSKSTTIQIDVWFERNGTCIWVDIQSAPVPCRKRMEIPLPLTGGVVRVEVDGTPVEELLTPEHIVIVGLGDSYGAGEGNPDYSAVWKADIDFGDEFGFQWLQDSNNLLSGRESFGSESKYWVDDNCHRSFFNHQSLTALRMASDHPHRFVSFLHYACTGAEIFDGILVPQYQAWGKGIYLPYSQLNFAIRELCQHNNGNNLPYLPVSSAELSSRDVERLGNINVHDFHRRGGKDNVPGLASNLTPDVDNFSRAFEKTRAQKFDAFPNSGFLTCEKEDFRAPNYVFLSIGGNDIGFADVVRYQIIPSRWKFELLGELLYPDVCPQDKYRVSESFNRQLAKYCRQRDKKINYHVGDLIGPGKPGGIERRYELLFNIVRTRLHVESTQIVMPQYPDALRTGSPTVACDQPLPKRDRQVYGDPKGSRADSAWNGLKTAASPTQAALVGRNMQRWAFNLLSGEAVNALRQFDDFRVILAATARKEGITFACDARDAFMGYGWWQGKHINLPNSFGADHDMWDLTSWNPYVYEEVTRAIRTGNDSALTQPGDKQITGSVHPNLTGHRLIAEEVYSKLHAENGK